MSPEALVLELMCLASINKMALRVWHRAAR